MKTIKEKIIKHKYLFLILELISIYLSYLLCRMHDYSKLAIISITFFLMTLGFAFTCWGGGIFNYKKNNKLVIASIIISLIILGFGFKFFTNAYHDVTINFNNNELDKNINTYIDGVIIDNVIYNIAGNNFANTYDKITDRAYIDNNQLIIKKARNMKINFNTKAEGLNLQEKDYEAQINLEKGYQNYIYEVQSNCSFDNISYFRLIASLLTILTITYLILNYLFYVKDKGKKYFLLCMLGALAIGLYYYLNIRMVYLNPDSPGYIKYDFEALKQFKLGGRTPVYPIIIHILYYIFKYNYYLNFVCIFQYLVWYISILYLFKLILLITKHEKLSLVASLLYALSPSIVGWNINILTESLALSGTLIFIYYIIKYIKENKVSYGITAAILAFVLTFHRPTAIILSLGLMIFWLARFIFEKEAIKKDLKSFITSLITIILIVIYACMFHKQYGIYSIANMVVRQDLYVNMQEGYYKASSDPVFIERVENAIAKADDLWYAMEEVLYQYSMKDMRAITNECRHKMFKEYTQYVLKLIKNHASVKFTSYGYSKPDNNVWLNNGLTSSFDLITFGHAYLFIIIELITSIYLWLKTKKVPWLDMGLFAFPFIIILSSFVGTCGEFMRTAICTVPFTYVAIILLIYRLIGGNKNVRILKEK